MKTNLAVLAAALSLAGCSFKNAPPPAPATQGLTSADVASVDVPSLLVSGEGRVTARPDRAQIVLGAVAQAPTAAEAQNQVSAVTRRVIDELKRLEIPEQRIQTVDLSVSPVFARDEPQPRGQQEQPRIVAFRAANRIQVQLDDLARVGPAVDAAIRAGANQLESLSFELADPGPRRAALRLAIADARETAQEMAAALGVRLGEVIDVVEAGGGPPIPLERGGFTEQAALASTPVQPGEIDVLARVSIRFRIYGQ
ncbi:MAG: SIMPL domain-containing protein [Myxococcales bacterium]|jgi:uncharacterized protein YggE